MRPLLRLVPAATALAAWTLAGAACAGAAAAQAATGGSDEESLAIDSADVRGRARAEQARFERRRVRYFPLTHASYGGSCDERVGRFCTWFEEGEWYPRPEAPEITGMREELLAYLDSVARLVPGDGWILGQRVWYRTQAGRWDDAALVARACGGVERWWCLALEGFAAHGAGRYVEAERIFADALEAMDPDQADRWRRPRRAVDGDLRDDLDDLEGEELSALLDRLWEAGDPLYLVAGNDRLTEHYARWVVVKVRSRARNPFLLSWGRDLETLTVRHGWEVGWERSRVRNILEGDRVIGHKHPEGRDYLPPGEALRDVGAATERDLTADRTRPRSLYAPPYAPVLLPMDGQVARFPRGGEVAVVATYSLPADTTLHADHTHAVPWMEPGDQEGLPDRIGLFLVPAQGGPAVSRVRVGSVEGALVLQAPAGAYVLSAESWSPSRRRAGRLRRGLASVVVPPDVPTLSDLLLTTGDDGDPATLAEAARRALARPRVPSGQPFGIVWEVGGLGFRPETLVYRLSVRKEGGNILRRAGRFLGLVGREEPIRLEWDEPGPDRPAAVLRHLAIDAGALNRGRYTVRLEVATAGRNALIAERTLEVVDPGAP